MSNFKVQPFKFEDALDVLKVHLIIHHLLKQENGLNGWEVGCEDGCGECGKCERPKMRIVANLTAPSTLLWEVLSVDPIDLAGILALTEVDPGRDASINYFFFDGRLSNKNEALLHWFDEVQRQFRLNRLTLKLPEYAFAALRHAQKLGFGGPFTHAGFSVEGVQRRALKSGSDIILLGRVMNG